MYHYLTNNLNVFITFEGIEGSGKTTQLQLIADWLKSRGHKICVTYEPGDNQIGGVLREILLKEGFEPHPYTEILLYLADRAEHLNKVIIPALKKGMIVLCDRYHDSTIAYQCYGRGLKREFVDLCFKYLNFINPDITFLLDVPVEVGFKRLKHRRLDRMERETYEFHQRVRQGFLKLAKEFSSRIHFINADKFPEEVNQEIKQRLIAYGL